MSALEVYVIDASGEVAGSYDARNSHGGAPHIWRQIAAKYGFEDPMMALISSKPGATDAFWKLQGSGKLTPIEDDMLAFTYDAIWVRRANVLRLIASISAWFAENRLMRSYEGKMVEVAATLDVTAGILRRVLAEHPDCMGVCFNMTSVNSSPWCKPDPANEDEVLPIVIGKDTHDANGNEITEVLT